MNLKSKAKKAKFHFGQYDPVAVFMWILLISLLVLPVIFGIIVATAGAAVGSIGGIL